MDPHHQRNLCPEQQGNLCQGEHHRRVEGGGRAGYSEKRNCYAQEQDPSVQRRHAAGCHGGDGRGYSLQGDTPQNNNNKNHAALAEHIRPYALHKLQQLDIYTNTDTPDTTHQLDAEAAATEVSYTMTNTQLSCSGGGESDRIPNTFKVTMGLFQAARWKAVLDKAIAVRKKLGLYELVRRYGMEGCKLANNPGVELALNQPEKKLLDDVEKRRYQAMAGAVYVSWTSHPLRHPLRGQPAGDGHVTACESSHGSGEASASLLRRFVAYKQVGFRLAAFSDTNWGNNPDNGRSTLLYIIMLANAPTSFKVTLQGLTTQSTMEAELVVTGLTMREAVLCSNMRLELGLNESFGSVPLYIDNTSALHVAGNRTYSPRAKHIAHRDFSLHKRVEEGKIGIHYVKIEDQLADLGTKKTLARTLTATPLSSSPSSRLTTPTTSSSTWRRPKSSCSRSTFVLVVYDGVLCSLYRVACTLHCSFVAS